MRGRPAEVPGICGAGDASVPAKDGRQSLGDALDWGRGILAGAGVEAPDLEAQILLADVCGIDRWRLFGGRRRAVEGDSLGRFRSLIERRAEGFPLAYLRGRREFWSLDLAVDHRVLVPRPETEVVVEAALEFLRPGALVADVGTGSGNIVIALATELGGGGWAATDISPEALEVARCNLLAQGLEGKVSLFESDLLDGLGEELPPFDAVVSNPPYVPTGEMTDLPRDVRCHEPPEALDGGPDGLRVIRRLLRDAPRRLVEGGRLVVEVGAGQAPAVREEALATGFYRQVETRRDLAGIERVLVAERA